MSRTTRRVRVSSRFEVRSGSADRSHSEKMSTSREESDSMGLRRCKEYKKSSLKVHKRTVLSLYTHTQWEGSVRVRKRDPESYMKKESTGWGS